MLEILLLVAFVVLPLIQQYLSRSQEASQLPGRRPARRASVPPPSPVVVPVRAEGLEGSTRVTAGAPVVVVKPALVIRRVGRTRPGGWRLNESDARRAVVLTAVFGPCRAIRPYQQE